MKKYLKGEATERERLIVEQWYALIDEGPRTLHPAEWEALEQRLWAKLENKAGLSAEEPSRPLLLKIKPFIPYAAAACASIVLLIVYTLWPQKPTLAPLDNGQALMINKENKVLTVSLEDGSKVMLGPQSQLRYPKKFAKDHREVDLIGEAFFEISENPQRPFFVNAGKITTKVLGTSFRVKAPQGQADVEVSVKTGKVSVYEKNKKQGDNSIKKSNGVILSPNHQVTFMADRAIFVTELVEQPVPVSPEEGQGPHFDFDDTPLAEVLRVLENTYSIDLELERKALKDCPLTANLTNKGLYAQLDLICAAIQGSYELKGTTILINGKGCD